MQSWTSATPCHVLTNDAHRFQFFHRDPPVGPHSGLRRAVAPGVASCTSCFAVQKDEREGVSSAALGAPR